MRLLGAAHVRNEADIVEAFVRHNLSALDGIAIVDHGSVDGTAEILRSLKDEGLPIFLAEEPRADFDQQVLTNRLVRHIFATSEASWVFPLDADEFLRARSREDVETALEGAEPPTHLALDWCTYVPSFDRSGDPLGLLRDARRVVADGHGFRKVIVSRAFAKDPSLYLTRGHHGVLTQKANGARAAPAVLPRTTLSIAHVPIRSTAQFTTKVTVGWLSSLRVPRRVPGESLHWQEAFEYVQSGRPLTPGQLEAFAKNYGVPMQRWRPTDAHPLVEDPFLRDFTLRYSKAATLDPLAIVLRHAERLLRSDGAAR